MELVTFKIREMNYFEFKNLKISVDYMEVDMSGEASLVVPLEYLENFLEDTDGCQFSESDLERHNEGDDLEIYNTDYQIIFMSWAMEQDTDIHFTYTTENIFWLYHDLNHSIHDVCGIEIYVDGSLEAKRHYQAIEMLKENNQLGLIDAEFLSEIKKEFTERSSWDRRFNSDDFDISKALELANIDSMVVSCSMCGCEDEPNKIDDELFKCEDCGHEGEEYEFKYNELEMLY